jgi:hypothetical protein
MVTRRNKRITPEIVTLFRRASELRDQGAESDYRDAYVALHLALGRAPWEADIFEALDEYRDLEITPEMIEFTRGKSVNAQWGLWKSARDLGLELERLDRESR